MRIVCVTSPASEQVAAFSVAHGVDPRRALFREGWVIVHLLSARLDDGEIVITALVRPRVATDRPPRRRRRNLHRDLDIDKTELPIRRQRIAAYALVTSREGLLGTQCSDRTAVPGIWQLPGGGVDEGETPAEAVIREVSEETAQDVRIDRLLDLQSDHWIGRAPDGTIEDVHALRLFYAATCLEPTTPRVLDVGGTTESAQWVPVGRWQQLQWTSGAHMMLRRHLHQLV